MKATEIFEGYEKVNIDYSIQEALPPTISVPDMDQYYEYYRFLVAIAGQPESAIPLQGPIADGTYIAPYTKQEMEHVIDVLNKMGKKHNFVTRKPSIETKNVNKKSPVRVFKDYDE
jgi:hypothetical protein